MNGRAICTLPVPVKPLSLDAPKPGMAFVRRVADIERRVGNAVTGWAYNGATAQFQRRGPLGFVGSNKVGDLASVAGVLISIIGFGFAVVGVFQSRNAAERAETAARAARDSIRLFDMVVDFTAAITTLEDLKRAHRSGQWGMLPDRYALIRKLLITLRTSNPPLTEDQKMVIQEALANLRLHETNIEKYLAAGESPNAVKLNAALSRDIDQLVQLLTELKMAKTGG